MKVSSSQVLILTIFCALWRVSAPTCVLESDFGLVINCAFKKSSLFRIRNLGGVKAHLSWGLTIGDELGFKESISNVEINRRRAAQGSKLDAQIVKAQQEAQEKKALVILPPSNVTNSSSNDSPLNIKIPLEATNENQTVYISTVPTLKEVFSRSTTTPLEASKKAPSKENEISGSASLDNSSTNKKTISNEIQGSKNNTITTRPRKKRPTRTKSKSRSRKKINNTNKIVLAPKEYHPLGYSINIDETFPSRVKLPKTSFQCKDQKYFPGLYADEDLGCMVFHVCAAIDTGVVTRSFLCPESTLFDQSTLKCNWWFYVDCKKSRQQYDTNIPVARSYQLMRILSALSARRLEETTPPAKEKV